MKKGFVALLIVGGVLMVAGLAIGGTGITRLGGDFRTMDRHEYVDNIYNVDEEFHTVIIDESITNIFFNFSEDNSTKVEVKEIKDQEHTISVTNDVLTIKENHDYWDWWKNGPILQKLDMNIYLPVKQYTKLKVDCATGSVKFSEGFTCSTLQLNTSTGAIEVVDIVANIVTITSSTGSINIEDATFNDTDIGSSTGNIVLNNTSGSTIEIDTSTGRVSLSDCLFDTQVEIDTSTGHVSLEKCDAPLIDINSSTGNINASLLSGKKFKCSSSVGNINVPTSIENGQNFNASTSTGNIIVTIVTQ